MARVIVECGSEPCGLRAAQRVTSVVVLTVVLAAALMFVTTVAAARTPGSYPRLANVYFPHLTGADLEALARYDVLVLPARGEELTRDELSTLRELNPGIILLAHMPIGYHGDWGSPSIFSDVIDAANEHNWWLRDRLGQRVRLGCGDYVLNLTTWCPPDEDGRVFAGWMAKHIADRLAPGGLWDGVFLDYCMDDISWVGGDTTWGLDADNNAQEDDPEELDDSWRAGTEMLVTLLREYVGTEYLIVTNGNNTMYEACDGGTREDFPNMHGDWYENVTAPGYGYVAMQSRYRKPTVNIINTIWYGAADPLEEMPDISAEQKLRYTLATTLVYGDGYYSFDGGRGLPHHCQMWWHELYEMDLGVPLERGTALEAWPGESPWITNGDMVAQRRFTRGMVLVNPSTSMQRVELGGVYYPSDSWNGTFYPYAQTRASSEVAYCTGEFYAGSGSVLSAVMDISFKEGADGDLLLTWNRVSGAVAYAVYRTDGRLGGEPGDLVAIVDGPQFRDDEGRMRSAVSYSVSPIDELLCEGRPSLPVSASDAAGGEKVAATMADLPYGRAASVESMDPQLYGERQADGAAGPAGDTELRSVLHGCAPNPAAKETRISFTLGDDERWGGQRPTTVTVFDVRGRVVRTLVNTPLPAGRHEVRWDLRGDAGRRVAAGCYLFALSAGDETLHGKLLVVN